jgi:exopolysaccharide biosynthesis polyprenyl glycosylphosphotransferase
MSTTHSNQTLWASERTQSFGRVSSYAANGINRATAGAILVGAMDFSLIWLSAVVALKLRVDAGAINYGAMLTKNVGFLMLLSILILLFCHAQKLYEARPRTLTDETVAVLKAVAFAAIALSASIYLSREEVVSRVLLGTTVLMSAVSLVSWRHIRRYRVAKRVAAGQDCRNVLIYGWTQAASALERCFSEHWLPGYTVKGFVDRRRRTEPIPYGIRERRVRPAQGIGPIDKLSEIVRTHFIDEIFVFLPQDRMLVKKLIAESRNAGITLRVVPDSYDGVAWGAPVDILGPFPAIQVHEKTMPVFGHVFKRMLDVIGSALALALLSPLIALVALAVRLDSPGPTFYCSKRIGRKGATFNCYKFRTMVRDAEALKEKLKDRNERTGLLFKIAEDPRITRIGRTLRKYSLDELPQLWNVLNGDMSLVGPRPPIPGEYQQYELNHLKRLHVLPGITGLWQVEARRDPSFDSYINLDTYYVDNWSVRLDLKILLKTFSVVVAGTGQ